MFIINIILNKKIIFLCNIYILADEGKGFPLVISLKKHGFLGSSKMWYQPQINFFKNYFRVITPDLPGFGKSNKTNVT